MNKVFENIVRCFLIIFLTTALLSLSFGCAILVPQENTSPNQQKMLIQLMLQEADFRFCNLISLEEREDATDGIHYTGVIGAELDAILNELVDTYNADPSTKDEISIENIRRNLTEGIAESAKEENWDSPFLQFLRWTDSAADLVYAENLYDDSGNVLHAIGDSARTDGISNFDFVKDREDFSSFNYSWKVEQPK